ncbi:hypothetical protein E2542_SST21487 [Spatholobus suberectus]|nr:hypothetical protein E2542_SST21487 [Spatholobus suberectus]
MSSRLAWDEFGILLHLCPCKNRENSERLLCIGQLVRSAMRVVSAGFILELWYVILSVNGVTFCRPQPVELYYFQLCVEVQVEVIDHRHCTVSVHKIFGLVSVYRV